MSYTVKLAETEQEYLGIRRLNHRTFASELGQHETTADEFVKRQVRAKSSYIITLARQRSESGWWRSTISRRFRFAQRLPDASLLDRIAGKSWKSACWRSIRRTGTRGLAGLLAQ